MGSKFGFGRIDTSGIARDFLAGGVRLAQEEWKGNFESESTNGESWEQLTYRDVPPPILDLTGKMKDETVNGKPSISVSGANGKAVLDINPEDERGRNYASFHEQKSSGDTGEISGDGDYGHNIQRQFLTQSEKLDLEQENLLERLTTAALDRI